MTALDEWFDLPDVDPVGGERPSVRVNWPSHINAYTDGGGDIDGDPIAILSLGHVEYRRPLSQLRLFMQAGIEALDQVQPTTNIQKENQP